MKLGLNSFSDERSCFQAPLAFVFCLLLGFFGASAKAQEGVDFTTEDGVFFGGGVGTILPFGIKGVRDNYSAWSMWFSHPTEVSQVEYTFVHANGNGVKWYNLAIGLRIDFEVLKAVRGYFTLGADGYYYQRKRTTLREFEFAPSGGMHLGFGVMQEVLPEFFLRADFKFGFSPGKTLYVGVGTVWEFGGAGAEPGRPK